MSSLPSARVILKTLNVEAFQKPLCEMCLNLRLLVALEQNYSNAFSCLTQGHFTVGSPLKAAVPEPNQEPIKVNRLACWQLVQKMQSFWRQWSTEFLSSLQQRIKWNQKRDDNQIKDVVLIKDENCHFYDGKSHTSFETIRLRSDNQGNNCKTATGETKTPSSQIMSFISRRGISKKQQQQTT